MLLPWTPHTRWKKASHVTPFNKGRQVPCWRSHVHWSRSSKRVQPEGGRVTADSVTGAVTVSRDTAVTLPGLLVSRPLQGGARGAVGLGRKAAVLLWF